MVPVKSSTGAVGLKCFGFLRPFLCFSSSYLSDIQLIPKAGCPFFSFKCATLALDA